MEMLLVPAKIEEMLSDSSLSFPMPLLKDLLRSACENQVKFEMDDDDNWLDGMPDDFWGMDEIPEPEWMDYIEKVEPDEMVNLKLEVSPNISILLEIPIIYVRPVNCV